MSNTTTIAAPAALLAQLQAAEEAAAASLGTIAEALRAVGRKVDVARQEVGREAAAAVQRLLGVGQAAGADLSAVVAEAEALLACCRPLPMPGIEEEGIDERLALPYVDVKKPQPSGSNGSAAGLQANGSAVAVAEPPSVIARICPHGDVLDRCSICLSLTDGGGEPARDDEPAVIVEPAPAVTGGESRAAANPPQPEMDLSDAQVSLLRVMAQMKPDERYVADGKKLSTCRALQRRKLADSVGQHDRFQITDAGRAWLSANGYDPGKSADDGNH